MSDLTRRAFVGAGVVGAAGLAIGVAIVLDGPADDERADSSPHKPPQPPPDPRIASLEAEISAHFDYLKLGDDTVATFVAAHLSAMERKPPSYETNALPEQFLLSTDFFRHGADMSRQVLFVAYFDPYWSPCYDPMKLV